MALSQTLHFQITLASLALAEISTPSNEGPPAKHDGPEGLQARDTPRDRSPRWHARQNRFELCLYIGILCFYN